MHALLHGNRHAAKDGGVSPQLIGRIKALLSVERRGFGVDHVCFFADDVYPNGIRAAEFVWEQLSKVFLPEQLTIEPIASTTRAEAEAYARYRAKRNGHGPVVAVTSFYHAKRCSWLLRQVGCEVKTITSRSFAVRDLVLELPKFALECTSTGRRIKDHIRTRSSQAVI